MENSWHQAASGQHYFYFPSKVIKFRLSYFSLVERLWAKWDEEAAAEGWLGWVPERLGTMI